VILKPSSAGDAPTSRWPPARRQGERATGRFGACRKCGKPPSASISSRSLEETSRQRDAHGGAGWPGAQQPVPEDEGAGESGRRSRGQGGGRGPGGQGPGARGRKSESFALNSASLLLNDKIRSHGNGYDGHLCSEHLACMSFTLNSIDGKPAPLSAYQGRLC